MLRVHPLGGEKARFFGGIPRHKKKEKKKKVLWALGLRVLGLRAWVYKFSFAKTVSLLPIVVS
jgi:hypothetical protein